ncbi:erythromycin esterase family protein [Paraliomyxa miuraensis]|uniref:erythromycin esterase family protein n=1 Tax=Paraliomyxa miuraensis TaxID=376150 RepID=UPI00225983F1|nr:erythromycin esterase family protein [Paraliomyxa miuraensis]MCX4239947.1 erythromycin esterase family protein [Paraliomyxa miuraensis]
MAACHATSSTTATVVPQAAQSEAASPFEGLELGFEHTYPPSGWVLDRSDYPATVDGSHAFEGQHSLALAHDGIHRRGTARLPLPIAAVRGQRVVATVHVRTEGVAHGGVGLRLQAQRDLDTLARHDTPAPKRLRGDQDWTPLQIELDVPQDAEEVELVLEHAGSGTAWFDAVELSVTTTSAPPPPATLLGTVRDATNAPVPDATVAVFSSTGEHTIHTTDDAGRFSVQTPAGFYVVGASAPAGSASALTELTTGEHPLELRLAPGPQLVRGTIHDDRGLPYPGVLATVMTAEEQLYPVRTDAEGRFSLSLPASTHYVAMIETPDGQRAVRELDDPNAELTASLPRTGAASPAALDWIAAHDVPLRTTEPRSGIDDLVALDPVFADATVVGLGEATHGTREFFQLKHRMLEYLVERHGFTVFGLEASRTECRAIDRYVQTGQGDPKQALAGIYFWTWDTEEVLDLIEWMREYNATHPRTLHFVGFDMQTPDVAARNVVAFLDQVDPRAPGRDALAMFGRPWNEETYAALSPAERADVETALERLLVHMQSQRAAWVAATSADAWADAHEDLVQVQQVVAMRNAHGMAVFSARDRAMADNVLHITERFGPDTKAVLWAHNGHVARHWSQTDVMGKYLSDALGNDYVSVGFAFDRGGFQALTVAGDSMAGLREHRVGSAKGSDIEAALRQAGPALFALPLRDLPQQGPAAQWLRSPLPMRQIGAGFDRDDLGARVIEPIPERFDVLLFVEETSRARPIERD